MGCALPVALSQQSFRQRLPLEHFTRLEQFSSWWKEQLVSLPEVCCKLICLLTKFVP